MIVPYQETISPVLQAKQGPKNRLIIMALALAAFTTLTHEVHGQTQECERNLNILLPKKGMTYFVLPPAGLELGTDYHGTLFSPDIPAGATNVTSYFVLEDGTEVDTLEAVVITQEMIDNGGVAVRAVVSYENAEGETVVETCKLKICFVIIENGRTIYLCEKEVTAANSPEGLGNDITIYPNPARDYVTIEYPGGIDEVRVLTSLGQKSGRVGIYQGNGASEMRVDLNGLPAGVYPLIVVSDGKYITEKLVIH